MLSKEELGEYIEKTGMQNLWQVERDYLQHIVLKALYSKVSSGLVFKGGTALQKLGVVDRFSIDLDFTSSLSDSELLGLMDYASGFLSDLGIRNKYSYSTTDVKHGSGFNANFEMAGPYFVSTKSEKAKAVIKLQISRREAVVLGQRNESIIPIYKDIPPYVATVMDMNEIAAEKVRAIMTREKPRDVYDLSMLVKKGYSIHELVVRKKLEAYFKFSTENFDKAIDKKRDLWISELENLLYKNRAVANFPSFEDSKSAILDFFKNNISLTIEFDTAKHGVNNDRGKTVMAERVVTLNDNVNIAGTHMYPPFDAKITSFFYAKYKHVHLEIYESGNRLIELSDAISFPQSTESLNIGNIRIRKGGDLYFELFIENEAGKQENVVYASVILASSRP